jgi:hypothetical protein
MTRYHVFTTTEFIDADTPAEACGKFLEVINKLLIIVEEQTEVSEKAPYGFIIHEFPGDPDDPGQNKNRT